MRTFLLCVLALILPAAPAYAAQPENPVVLVLADGLTWEQVENEPLLDETFEDGAAANLLTAQGAGPEDPRVGYLFMGAGALVDTGLLPENLPRETADLPGAFGGPASTVQPGTLGETLEDAGVRTAAVGRRAQPAVMDSEGQVTETYPAAEPAAGLERALSDGARFVVVDAGGLEEAGRLSKAAREAGATVALASPNAPPDSANLTPFVVDGPEGVLYSPTTRTEALLSIADVAPTLLSGLGVDPPPEMPGSVATTRPGTVEQAERVGDRLAFVAERRSGVFVLVGSLISAALALGYLWKRKRGFYAALLTLPTVPAGALLAAAFPLTNVPAVAFLILAFAGALVAPWWKLSRSVPGAIAGTFLSTALLVVADAAAGGALMKFSVLGYNPAYGARFYGVGNEYAAVLAGSLTMGLSALAAARRLPVTPAAVAGALTVVILGLPTMGADVGGSLALGFGFGATLGLLQGRGWTGTALWAGSGFLLATVLFLSSGLLFADASHGSRAAGGEVGLLDMVFRKLLLSIGHLTNPVYLAIFALVTSLTFAGWRRVRGTVLGAGLLGSSVTALALGALNDSGISVSILALVYPAVVALGILLLKDSKSRNLQ